jgi:hypothetical protein
MAIDAKKRVYRERNKESIAARQKAYVEENREAISAYNKKYREENRERLEVYDKERRKNNRQYNIERSRAYYRKKKDRFQVYFKKRYEDKKEEIAAYQQLYRQKNREKLNAYDKEKYRNNKDRILKSNADRHRKRLRSDPHYRVRIRLGTRLYQALKHQGQVKDATMLKLIGCTRSELMLHLQSRFRLGMEWNNYGPVWHVDHIRPCASFDLTSLEQQRLCFHWTNLQPLFGEENLKKGPKYHAVR